MAGMTSQLAASHRAALVEPLRHLFFLLDNQPSQRTHIRPRQTATRSVDACNETAWSSGLLDRTEFAIDGER